MPSRIEKKMGGKTCMEFGLPLCRACLYAPPGDECWSEVHIRNLSYADERSAREFFIVELQYPRAYDKRLLYAVVQEYYPQYLPILEKILVLR